VAALRVERVRLPLRAPLRTAWGDLAERELVRVRLAFSEADWGDGEAAPLEPYDGVPLGAVLAALDAYGALLAETGPDEDHRALLAACWAERPLPQALAAIDLALWDRAGRRAGRAVAELLIEPAEGSWMGAGARPADSGGGRPAARRLDAVPVNALIGAEDRAGAAAAARRAAAAGFTCVKVKVGVGDDAGRLAAVRAAVGPAVAIRADANGAWRSPEEALANLRALAPVGLELCEEPVHGVDALRAVRAESPIPIAMDETAAPASGATDSVCLKVARSGGISGLLADARAARETGAQVYVASSFDGPLGIAAGLHAAAALAATGPLLPCGLATLDAFEAAVPTGLTPRAGAIAVPTGPGLLTT